MDTQSELSDEEFACLVLRSCGNNLGVEYNLAGVFRTSEHQITCGFCTGEKKVAS